MIRSNKKELAKKFILNVGMDTILQSMIEIMDDSIEATDYDIDSVRNPKDLWKFQILENLEKAYDFYLKKVSNQIIGDQV
jgi:hypothetical protein